MMVSTRNNTPEPLTEEAVAAMVAAALNSQSEELTRLREEVEVLRSMPGGLGGGGDVQVEELRALQAELEALRAQHMGQPQPPLQNAQEAEIIAIREELGRLRENREPPPSPPWTSPSRTMS